MDFAHLSRPKSGESFCGDAVGVFGDGPTRLFAVTDGLGHGPEAHQASTKAMEFFAGAWSRGVEELVWGCHDFVRETRGLALFLCRIEGGTERTLECAGIGNIECKAVGPSRIAPFSRDGIVGHRMRKVTSTKYGIQEGDTLAIFTDGLHSRFDLAQVAGLPPRQAAQALMDGWGKDYDDATVLVIRA